MLNFCNKNWNYKRVANSPERIGVWMPANVRGLWPTRVLSDVLGLAVVLSVAPSVLHDFGRSFNEQGQSRTNPCEDTDADDSADKSDEAVADSVTDGVATGDAQDDADDVRNNQHDNVHVYSSEQNGLGSL